MRFRGVILAGVLALAGCGPMADDPSNIPQLGRWERTVKVTALIANDVWIERKDAPFKVPEDSTEITQCMEPALNTAEGLNREMMKGGDSDLCKFGEIVRDGKTFHSEGKCEPREKNGGTLSGTVELTGRQDSDNLIGKMSSSLIFKDQTGASQRVRFGIEAKWKRLGDCGRG